MNKKELSASDTYITQKVEIIEKRMFEKRRFCAYNIDRSVETLTLVIVAGASLGFTSCLLVLSFYISFFYIMNSHWIKHSIGLRILLEY